MRFDTKMRSPTDLPMSPHPLSLSTPHELFCASRSVLPILHFGRNLVAVPEMCPVDDLVQKLRGRRLGFVSCDRSRGDGCDVDGGVDGGHRDRRRRGDAGRRELYRIRRGEKMYARRSDRNDWYRGGEFSRGRSKIWKVVSKSPPLLHIRPLQQRTIQITAGSIERETNFLISASEASCFKFNRS